jgi:hypothetical protein
MLDFRGSSSPGNSDDPFSGLVDLNLSSLSSSYPQAHYDTGAEHDSDVETAVEADELLTFETSDGDHDTITNSNGEVEAEVISSTPPQNPGLQVEHIFKASTLKRVPQSEFLKASYSKRVPQSEFLQASTSKRVPPSEFLQASSFK